MTVRILWCTDQAELACDDQLHRCYRCPLNMRPMVFGDLFHDCSEDWVRDSYRWRGAPMLGAYGHWCPDWDYLPIDANSQEWPCPCGVGDAFRTGVKIKDTATFELLFGHR